MSSAPSLGRRRGSHPLQSACLVPPARDPPRTRAPRPARAQPQPQATTTANAEHSASAQNVVPSPCQSPTHHTQSVHRPTDLPTEPPVQNRSRVPNAPTRLAGLAAMVTRAASSRRRPFAATAMPPTNPDPLPPMPTRALTCLSPHTPTPCAVNEGIRTAPQPARQPHARLTSPRAVDVTITITCAHSKPSTSFERPPRALLACLSTRGARHPRPPSRHPPPRTTDRRTTRGAGK